MARRINGLLAGGCADALREEGRRRRMDRARFRSGTGVLVTSMKGITGIAGASETRIALFSQYSNVYCFEHAVHSHACSTKWCRASALGSESVRRKRKKLPSRKLLKEDEQSEFAHRGNM